MKIITGYDKTSFNKPTWYAMTDDDTDGLTVSFGDNELDAIQECYQKLVYEDLEQYLDD